MGEEGHGFCKLKLLGSVRGQEIARWATNPEKKGEEVTEQAAGLSEELMNTPQPFRDQGQGSAVQEGGGQGAEGETRVHPLEIWGTGCHRES